MPQGKPYTPVTSKAQSRKLFALAQEGKISEDDAKGKTRAANWDKLPPRKRNRRAHRSAGRRA